MAHWMLTNANNYLSVGRDAMGTFEQSNGTVNVKNSVIVGHHAGSVGRYTIRDGSPTAGGNLDVGQALPPRARSPSWDRAPTSRLAGLQPNRELDARRRPDVPTG